MRGAIQNFDHIWASSSLMHTCLLAQHTPTAGAAVIVEPALATLL